MINIFRVLGFVFLYKEDYDIIVTQLNLLLSMEIAFSF